MRRCTGDTDSHSPLSGFPPYKPGIIDAGDGWAGVGGKRRVGAVFLWRTLLVSWSAAEWRWEEVVCERKRKSKSEILKSKSAGGVVRGGGRDGASPRVSSKKRKKKKNRWGDSRRSRVPVGGSWKRPTGERRAKASEGDDGDSTEAGQLELGCSKCQQVGGGFGKSRKSYPAARIGS